MLQVMLVFHLLYSNDVAVVVLAVFWKLAFLKTQLRCSFSLRPAIQASLPMPTSSEERIDLSWFKEILLQERSPYLDGDWS